jgi:40S ribosome biogenesis protein Tsr1 and BMS1 C-terminal
MYCSSNHAHYIKHSPALLIRMHCLYTYQSANNRVRKRRAVVKHMFNFQEDIKWFKPAELTTKYGLSGHIKEPVGTHGLMKVIFNKHVKQNDTVCLPLYKRVYPKLDGDRIRVV